VKENLCWTTKQSTETDYGKTSFTFTERSSAFGDFVVHALLTRNDLKYLRKDGIKLRDMLSIHFLCHDLRSALVSASAGGHGGLGTCEPRKIAT
jgi:hypothetical protein